MVIGSDILSQILVEGVQTLCDTVLPQNTISGRIHSGPVTVVSFSTQVEEISTDTLGDQLRKFWEEEEIPQTPQTSNWNQACENIYNHTTTRASNGRMECTVKKTEELNIMYKNVLQEFLYLEHMEFTYPREIISSGNYHSFYLPHYMVVKLDIVTTKVQMVFNDSRKSCSGNSLNDVLHTGPTPQPDLMIHGIDSASESLFQEVSDMKSAGVILKKLTENNATILPQYPKEDLLDSSFLIFESSSKSKTLGIQ
ncbi:uncharacterized protein LOC110118831 [Ceratitis capitata]|uniref:uncharacterized protein LOC110118831 n=1 Tax=Ceratitis capitata TaxID=7213 RepID=UPI000A11DB41|nr:uncharacterized protein LOC110118831 [Ceratitis capitata]